MPYYKCRNWIAILEVMQMTINSTRDHVLILRHPMSHGTADGERKAERKDAQKRTRTNYKKGAKYCLIRTEGGEIDFNKLKSLLGTASSRAGS